MNITSIIRRVYREPWLVTTEAHDSIRTALEFYAPAQARITEDDLVNGGCYIRDGVAVIPVYGVLGRHLGMLEMSCGGYSVDELGRLIDDAVSDTGVSKILLDFDSPGGTVLGTPETAGAIAAADAVKPVYAFTEASCCSGALWLASQARAMFCTPSSRVGSVGVYAVYLDESRQLAAEGVTVNAISAGEHKLMGAPWKPMTDEERAILQADVDKIYGQFKASIQRRRSVDDKCMSGLVYDGEDAVRFGFCNGGLVSSITEAITAINDK